MFINLNLVLKLFKRLNILDDQNFLAKYLKNSNFLIIAIDSFLYQITKYP